MHNEKLFFWLFRGKNKSMVRFMNDRNVYFFQKNWYNFTQLHVFQVMLFSDAYLFHFLNETRHGRMTSCKKLIIFAIVPDELEIFLRIKDNNFKN